MPYFLVREITAAGGRLEVAREGYKTRPEAQAALQRHRGRWTLLAAGSWLEATRQASAGPHPPAPSPTTKGHVGSVPTAVGEGGPRL